MNTNEMRNGNSSALNMHEMNKNSLNVRRGDEQWNAKLIKYSNDANKTRCSNEAIRRVEKRDEEQEKNGNLPFAM